MGDPFINSDYDEVFRVIICRQKATLEVFPEYSLEFRIFCANLIIMYIV